MYFHFLEIILPLNYRLHLCYLCYIHPLHKLSYAHKSLKQTHMLYNSIASIQNILLLSSSQCFVSFVIVYRRYCLCNSQTIPSEHYVSCNKDLKKKSSLFNTGRGRINLQWGIYYINKKMRIFKRQQIGLKGNIKFVVKFYNGK